MRKAGPITITISYEVILDKQTEIDPEDSDNEYTGSWIDDQGTRDNEQ